MLCDVGYCVGYELLQFRTSHSTESSYFLFIYLKYIAFRTESGSISTLQMKNYAHQPPPIIQPSAVF
jgi:hypothetical protein